MGIALLIGVAVAAASVVLAAAVPISLIGRERLAMAFARKVNLDPRADLVGPLGDRLARRARLRLGAAGAGLGAGIVIMALVLPGHGEHGWPIAFLGYWTVTLVGYGFGTLVVQAMDDLGGQRPRAAHLVTPTVLDFVTPAELWCIRVMALVVVTAAGFGVATAGADAGQRTAAVALLATSALLWLALELSIMLVARSRPAASDVQSLAFDDAMRADSLRATLSASTFLPTLAIGAMYDAGAPLWFAGALVLAYVGAFIVFVWSEHSPVAKQRFRHRLWGTPVTDPSTLSR